MLPLPSKSAVSLLATAFIVMLAPGIGVPDEVAEQPNETWWSLRPITRGAPPPLPPEYRDFARNPIDHFVLAKLQEKKLRPAPPADCRTLLRRVTFDLIGLPPTPEELSAFENDPAPDAYERVVDRLLASPHYGERWARHWMDVIHFAETHGHDQDVPRDHAWPYRDYLITSFNNDKPYGRFVEQQIAGDVLYPDDPQAIVALGFLAAGPWDESSLRDIREDTLDRKAAQYLDRDDMIGTVGLTLLSTTVQCARCHDHKFDPITKEEYYGLQAVFAGVDRADRPYDADPAIRARRLALTRRKAELEAGGTAVAAKLRADPALAAEVAAWEAAQGRSKDIWTILAPAVAVSTGGANPAKLPDLSIRFDGKRPEKDTYRIECLADLPAITAIRLEVLTDDRLPHRGPGRQDNGNLHLSEFQVEVAPASDLSKKQKVSIARAIADFNQAGWDITRAIDGNMTTAWGIYPEVGKPHAAVFVLKEPLRLGKTRLFFTLEQQHGGGHLIGRPRLSVTGEKPPPSLRQLPDAIRKILATLPGKRSDKEKNELALHALREKTETELAALPPAQLVYAAAHDFMPQGSFRPSPGCRPIHVLKRGDIRKPGKSAAPAALACVSGLNHHFRLQKPDDEGQRRAALAHWLSDPRNPLTWRSIVNRVWHYHFGHGIVATPSDLGRMGAKPTHPELLDWMAARFLQDGGSLKKLHRLIVTSATYRQSSRHSPEFARLDGDNLYLWRMNRSRLDAESLRDAVLQISGQLDPAMGGPSVKHFIQSPGIHRTPKADYLSYDPDGPGAHRRSVYRFIFRTVPDPFMDALDCPDASQFAPVRATSVTALQALALLNDHFMVRMSEHFARRVASAGTVEKQVEQAFRLALGRMPTSHEQTALIRYAARHGMANACRVLFNCNEFVYIP